MDGSRADSTKWSPLCEDMIYLTFMDLNPLEAIGDHGAQEPQKVVIPPHYCFVAIAFYLWLPFTKRLKLLD